MAGLTKGKKLKKGGCVAVLMGGMSSEREISLKSGSAVLEALLEKGYDARGVDVGPEVASELISLKPRAAFVALHGRLGEDGSIQGLLEVMGIPYTGSGVLSSALAMDKTAAKRLLVSENIPTPEFEVACMNKTLRRVGKSAGKIIELPVVVKPATGGSTIGISVVRKKTELAPALQKAFQHDAKVLIERFVDGRELTVSVLDNKALAIIEICPKHGFYDFKAKYTKGMTDFLVPAKLDRAVAAAVKKTALSVYKAFGCRGAARVDIILGKDNVPYVLEINTVPGLTELSLLPKAAGAIGIGYPELVEKMLLGARLGA